VNLRQTLCALLFVLVVGSVFAQVTTGTPPFGSFGGGPFDVINLGNLNVHFSVPVVHKAGRGLPFNFDLSFDNSIWTPTGGAWVPDATWGWRMQTDASSGYAVMTSRTIQCTVDGVVEYGTSYTYKAYVDASGTSHPFIGLSVGDICGWLDTATATAKDGSGYVMSVGLGAVNYVTTRDGTKFTPPVNVPTGNGTVTDRNGNFITTNGTTITDTLGTQALSWSVAGSPPTYTYNVKNPSGSTSQIKVFYGTHSVKTNFGCSGISEYK